MIELILNDDDLMKTSQVELELSSDDFEQLFELQKELDSIDNMDEENQPNGKQKNAC